MEEVVAEPNVLDELVRRVQALHSYDVPEIIALPLAGGSEPYLRWLGGEVHGNSHVLNRLLFALRPAGPWHEMWGVGKGRWTRA
jgi:hypothetical protein